MAAVTIKRVADAELEGVKIIAKERLDSKKIGAEYEAKLEELTVHTEQILAKYNESVESDLKRLSNALEKRIATGISKNETFLQEQTANLSGQLGKTFTALEANAKEQIRSNVEKEFISVKKIIETYRQERYAIVDSKILSTLLHFCAARIVQTKRGLPPIVFTFLLRKPLLPLRAGIKIATIKN